MTQGNPMIDSTPKPPRVFMRDGAWLVPPEERPKGWETMGLREQGPALRAHDLPNALRELPPIQPAGVNVSESNDLKLNTSIEPAGQVAQLKWVNIRPLFQDLKIGGFVLVPVPDGLTLAKFQGNLSSILHAWKETQMFKWSVVRATKTELRVTKTGEYGPSAFEVARDGMAAAKKRPDPPAPPIQLPPPAVELIEQPTSQIDKVLAFIDDKIQKLAELRRLMEDPYIAQVVESMHAARQP